ncbi:MAG: hypothetical protein LBJ16_01805 [Holosporaceae bacterium]|jgi:dipeptidyl aminopeptidase/acylaminoacyl peptidase|nr:hypothetical protein [Holosporaceae bacterium]
MQMVRLIWIVFFLSNTLVGQSLDRYLAVARAGMKIFNVNDNNRKSNSNSRTRNGSRRDGYRESDSGNRYANSKSYADSKSRNTRGHPSKINVPLISRNRLFEDDRIKEARISPWGDRLVYLAKNEGGYVVYVSEIDKPDSPEWVVRDNFHIEAVEFIDNNNLVYVFRDTHGSAQLMALNLRTKDRQQINLNINADNISIMKGGCLADFVALAEIGGKFATYRVNVNTLSCKKLRDYPTLPVMLLGGNLEPLLSYDFSGENGATILAQVSGDDRRKEEGLKQIDTIQDIRTQRALAFLDNSDYFKLIYDNDQIIFSSQNLKTGETKESVVMNSSDIRISDCDVNLEGSGKPLFITIDENGRKIHVPLFKSAVGHLNFLDQKFPNSDWQRVDASQDGSTWLIRVTNPLRPDRYFAYNCDEHSLNEVAASSKNIGNAQLQKMECFRIPETRMADKDTDGNRDQDRGRDRGRDEKTSGGISVKLIRSPNYNSRSPLMVIVESDAGKRSEWAFNPHLQLLANRGINVLVVHCSAPLDCAPKDVIDYEVDDILDAVNWCIKRKICFSGNVNLYARGANCVAAFIAFQEKQNIFSSCILQVEGSLGRDGILSHKDNSHELSNPLMIIESSIGAKAEEKKLSSLAKNTPLSYITYALNLDSVANAALQEKFLEMILAGGGIRFEVISLSVLRGHFRFLLDANNVFGNNNSHNSHGRSSGRNDSDVNIRHNGRGSNRVF